MAIGADCTYPELTDKHKLADLCKNLNFRHKMAQYAQRASVAFHTQVLPSFDNIRRDEILFIFNLQNCFVHLKIFKTILNKVVCYFTAIFQKQRNSK